MALPTLVALPGIVGEPWLRKDSFSRSVGSQDMAQHSSRVVRSANNLSRDKSKKHHKRHQSAVMMPPRTQNVHKQQHQRKKTKSQKEEFVFPAVADWWIRVGK